MTPTIAILVAMQAATGAPTQATEPPPAQAAPTQAAPTTTPTEPPAEPPTKPLPQLLSVDPNEPVLFIPEKEEPPDPNAPKWRLALGAGTDFPLGVFARGHLEAPWRGRLSTSIGILPGTYVDAINGVAGYGDQTAELVKSTLSTSLLWRTHLGYRLFPKLGLYIEAGYGLVTLGGSTSGAELVQGVTGFTAPDSARTQSRTYQITSTLHMLDVEVGYELTLLERLIVRLAVGGAFTVGASTTMDAQFTPRSADGGGIFTRAASAAIDDVYKSYVFTPVVGLSLSYVVN